MVTPESELINHFEKRLLRLRKKVIRCVEMEEKKASGETLSEAKKKSLLEKSSVMDAIDVVEKLRQPLFAKEITLTLQLHSREIQSSIVEDLLDLVYFGALLKQKKERGFFVTDDLGKGDLDLISNLGGLVVSRPINSSLSHKDALTRCMEHAKLWLGNSDQRIAPDSNITYLGLRASLDKIMASDYFTNTPEMNAAVQRAANTAVQGAQVLVMDEGIRSFADPDKESEEVSRIF